MASIGYIKFSKHSLNRMLEILNENKENEIEVTFSIKDVINNNDSVNVWEMQTQEEIKQKEEKRYLSKEGKIFWSNNVATTQVYKKSSFVKNKYKKVTYDESFLASERLK
jgi:hypothetical protein